MSQVLRKLFGRKESPVGLRELIGRRCAVVFDMPANQWPFPGYPAWLYVIDVEDSMIKLGYSMEEKPAKWISKACILTIIP